MTLRSNTLLKVLVPTLLVIVLLIVVRGLSGGGGDAGTDAETAETDPTLTLSDDELQALGIEGILRGIPWPPWWATCRPCVATWSRPRRKPRRCATRTSG